MKGEIIQAPKHINKEPMLIDKQEAQEAYLRHLTAMYKGQAVETIKGKLFILCDVRPNGLLVRSPKSETKFLLPFHNLKDH